MEKKILLVDDEPDIRDVLTLSLSDMGYQVYEAENGEEGLRILKDKLIAIITNIDHYLEMKFPI